MPKARLQRKDLVWTSDLAYAVGLIATDGNLSLDKRHICLTSCDVQLLETFKKCLKKNNSISDNPSSAKSKKPSYKVQMSDVVLYNWLNKIGVTSKKSLTIGKLDIDSKYFQDFLRGHIDGDGSIIYYKDYYNTYLNPKYIYDRLFVYFLSASKKHIVWIQNMIKKLIGISGSFESINPSKSMKVGRRMYRLKFSTKQAKILLNWIYYKKNLPCLHRKYEIAKPFLQFT